MPSCDLAKEKTKKAVNKTGKIAGKTGGIIGKTGSEFGNGIYKGVKKTFENDVKVSDALKEKGLGFGEVLINSIDSTADNVLTAYVVFNENFDQEITVKIFAENGKEHGRLKRKLIGEKGNAKHFDFIFDKNVSIGIKGNINVE